jgi:RNA polymerase sigma-70 factor (ECF subfamily)
MAGEPRLSDLFRASVSRQPKPAFLSDLGLEERLLGAVASARERWPSVAIDAGVFVAYLAERLPSDATSLEALDDLHITDLWLACACARRDSGAVALFLEEYLAPTFPLPRDLAPLSNDVEQMASVKLFVSEGSAAPKIGDYSGLGDLRSWVKIVVLRIALGLLRKEKPEVEIDESILASAADDQDAEVVHLKNRYRAEFREAFRHALSTLEARERNVLRQRYVDGLTLGEIGRVYGVHRITVVRWIDKARDDLSAATRKELLVRFGIGRAELASIVRLIQSQLDLSLRAHLRGEAET